MGDRGSEDDLHHSEEGSEAPAVGTEVGMDRTATLGPNGETREHPRPTKTMARTAESFGDAVDGASEAVTSEKCSGRVYLVISFSGNNVCWPGVCTLTNNWTIDGRRYQVGHLLHGTLALGFDEHGKPDLNNQFRIHAVVSAQKKETFPESFDLEECADAKGCREDGARPVLVVCCQEPVPFTGMQYEERPLMDLDEIRTPPTPG